MPEDNDISEFCKNLGVECYRGSSENVLDRYLAASSRFHCDRFLRVCSDNPFLDAGLMSKQIELFDHTYDYCSYYYSDGLPAILKPAGFFVEAVTRAALIESKNRSKLDVNVQEHVTCFIYSHPEIFRIKKIAIPSYIDAELRFTIDYPEDVANCEEIIKNCETYSAQIIVDHLSQNTNLLDRVITQTKKFPKKYFGIM